ncbi:hypothetical protein DXV76_15275 [Rhodobacteraceae bacterium CCMM004]|nr:hypothetical protein DXV76_15275 [Rhodobacteraceae bacterium CCMM004]
MSASAALSGYLWRAAFQAGLAAGLPEGLRRASLGVVLLALVGAALSAQASGLWTPLPWAAVRWALLALAALFGLSTVLNLLGAHGVECARGVPVALLICAPSAAAALGGGGGIG